MPKISAWKCSQTGKLFENKRDYIQHLRETVKCNREMEKHRLEQQRKDRIFQEAVDSIQSAFTIKLLQEKLETAIPLYFYKMAGVGLAEFNVSLDVRWIDSCSNTHACPKNGVMNWGGRVAGAPRGYPGYCGTIHMTGSQVYWDDYEFATWGVSTILKRLRIHTGTGGGGHKRCQYDVIIFDDDFPRLVEGRVRSETIEEIIV